MCQFIFNSYIKYYTKECAKILKIGLIGFFIISAIILIKYKPVYKVSILGKNIGYSKNKNNIYSYIDGLLNNNEENVAFVLLEEEPEFKLQLANRNIKTAEETIKEEISSRIEVQYTSYAITYNKENIAYVSNENEAERVISKLKEEYKETYTDKLGVLQVYSEEYSNIEAINTEKAYENINETIKSEKKKDETKIKLASNKKKITNKKTNTSVKKESSINGIKLSVRPIEGIITSRYGGRNSPGGIGSTNHKGVDIAAKQGTSIKACASGTVTFSGTKGSLGNLIIISHENGVETYYAHCSKLIAQKGDKVSAGDIIAQVGRTGAATGSHLHLEVHVNGTAVNPQKYIY